MSGPHGLLADVVEFSCVDGPGNRFVAFLQGCNFDCVACHNPHTIALHSPAAHDVEVAELVDRVRPLAPFLSGVTLSGGEATRQARFAQAFFAAIKHDAELGGLTTFIDSNGAAPPHVWALLDPVLDGAMIDLKALDPGTHRLITGRTNSTVLASIELLAGLGKLYEVRLLLLPGFNDDERTLQRTGAWLASVDPNIRIKLIGFRRHGTLPPVDTWPEPTAEQMERAADVIRGEGLADIRVV